MTVHVGDHGIRVHRVIVCAASTYFADICENDRLKGHDFIASPPPHRDIYLHEVDSAEWSCVVACVLVFLYSKDYPCPGNEEFVSISDVFPKMKSGQESCPLTLHACIFFCRAPLQSAGPHRAEREAV